MATPVIMPKQGQSVESCIITKWHKKVGDDVKEGELLFSYETDKASFDEEAKADGKMLAIFFEEGDEADCLVNVCVIGNEGEDVSEFAPGIAAPGQSSPEATKESVSATPATQPEQKAESAAASNDGFVKISPRARGLAEKSGADIRYAEPTGANGRIMARDIEKVIVQGKVATYASKDAYYASGNVVSGTGIGGRVTTYDLSAVPAGAGQQKPVAEFEEVALSNIRKIIAKSMHASLSQSAQLTLNASFDATDILAFRKKLKENAETLALPNITINDIILYAVSRALVRHREINAHYMGDRMLLFGSANIGIACDTDRGLMVPTLFAADKLSLAEIAAQSKKLTTACKEGSISPDLLTGGTFTVTNLGTLGVESFTPVINPPQTGILGVCAMTERTKNGKAYPAIGLSLTFDHRAIDGAPAARFLQEVVKILESFSFMLALR